MAVNTRRFESTVQLDSGLIIPASAAAGKVLTSDASGNATWQAPASVASNAQARAYRNAALNLAPSTWTKVPVDTAAPGDNPGSNMDLTTNHRYNVPAAGWYQVSGTVSAITTASGQQIQAGVWKNGGAASYGTTVFSTAGGQTLSAVISEPVHCAAGDYLELYGFSSSALSLNSGALYSHFAVVSVGS